MQPKTPERKPGAARPVPDITPLSRGTSIRQRQDGNTDRVDGYVCDDYDDYVREDLKSRVFVDFEVFMKRVLHVPEDWRTEWRPVIEAVLSNPEFKNNHEEYRKCCNNRSAREVSFYGPLMGAANAVLSVLSRPQFSGSDSGIPQLYHVNDPKKFQGGSFSRANLPPDPIVLPEGCGTEAKRVRWANALHILEVKPYGTAICDGDNMPRLVFDGEYAMCPLRILL